MPRNLASRFQVGRPHYTTLQYFSTGGVLNCWVPSQASVLGSVLDCLSTRKSSGVCVWGWSITYKDLVSCWVEMSLDLTSCRAGILSAVLKIHWWFILSLKTTAASISNSLQSWQILRKTVLRRRPSPDLRFWRFWDAICTFRGMDLFNVCEFVIVEELKSLL